jgi:hypothetical protein
MMEDMAMADQVQIMVDRDVYDRLLSLQVPPYSDINAVLDRLLFHAGRKSREAIALEADERNYTFEEEIQRAKEGLMSGSGIAP